MSTDTVLDAIPAPPSLKSSVIRMDLPGGVVVKEESSSVGISGHPIYRQNLYEIKDLGTAFRVGIAGVVEFLTEKEMTQIRGRVANKNRDPSELCDHSRAVKRRLVQIF